MLLKEDTRSLRPAHHPLVVPEVPFWNLQDQEGHPFCQKEIHHQEQVANLYPLKPQDQRIQN